MKSKQLDQINKYSSLIHVHVLQVSDDAKNFFCHKTSKSMYANLLSEKRTDSTVLCQ